ncbi:hypothetical protein [Sulfuricurvum sp.]|uniref:hypothetical protein n=1 Tax=Sulfuricurvum sp. TaxID=2025608 RepID=UPI003565D63C
MKLYSDVINSEPNPNDILLPLQSQSVEPDFISVSGLEKAKFNSGWWSKVKHPFIGVTKSIMQNSPTFMGNTTALFVRNALTEEAGQSVPIFGSMSYPRSKEPIDRTLEIAKDIYGGMFEIPEGADQYQKKFVEMNDKISGSIAKSLWALTDKNRDWVEKMFPTPIDNVDRVLQDVGSGLLSNAESAALLVFGGVLSPLIYFGLIEAGQKFREMDEAGVGIHKATFAAALSGFNEGAIESVSTYLSWNLTLPWLIRGGLTAILNGTEEVLQSASSDTISYVFGSREWEGKASTKQMVGSALYAGAIGTIVGGITGFSFAAMQRNRVQKILESGGMNQKQAKLKANELMAKTATQNLEEMEKNLFGQMVKEQAVVMDAVTGKLLTGDAQQILNDVYQKYIDEGLIKQKEGEEPSPAIKASAIDQAKQNMMDQNGPTQDSDIVEINDIVSRETEIRKSILMRDGNEKAIRKIEDLAQKLGVRVGRIRYEDTQHFMDWNLPEDQIVLRQHGETEESYNERIKSGRQLFRAGLHTTYTGRDGQQWSEIRVFRGFDATDIYHEFAHAVEEQGGIPNWAGTKEEHAHYIEQVIAEGREGAIAEFTEEGRKIDSGVKNIDHEVTALLENKSAEEARALLEDKTAQEEEEPGLASIREDIENSLNELDTNTLETFINERYEAGATQDELDLLEEIFAKRVSEDNLLVTEEDVTMSEDSIQGSNLEDALIDTYKRYLASKKTGEYNGTSTEEIKNNFLDVLKEMATSKPLESVTNDQVFEAAKELYDAKQALLKRQKKTKGQASVREIPKFKTTDEAQAFGKIASMAELIEMQRRRDDILAKNKKLLSREDLTDKDMQQGMYDAVEAQLYRESIEASPVQHSLRVAPEDAPLKSNLLAVVQYKIPNSVSGDQALKTIENSGMSKEEIEFSGIKEFLKSKDKFTKQEILDYVEQNKVQVNPVIKSNEQRKYTIDEVEYQGIEKNGNITIGADGETGEVAFHIIKVPDNVIQLPVSQYPTKESAIERVLQKTTGYNLTKYSQYTLPGGENYQETLLTVPNESNQPTKKDYDDFTMFLSDKYQKNGQRGFEIDELTDYEKNHLFELSKAQKERKKYYQSHHWEEPNVLVHHRTNQRTDAQGNKGTFVEEIQSDWHREGKQQGYGRGRLPDGWRIEKPTEQQQKDGLGVWNIRDENNVIQYYGKTEQQMWDDFGKNQFNKGVPSAPFKNTWHELALKDIIRQAVERGDKFVAFISGEQTADRYDLSKQVDSIGWTDYPSQGEGMGILTAYKENNEVIKKTINKAEIDSYLGKDVGKKLLEQPKDAAGRHLLKGDQLKVGGEWAKKFYDEILPKTAEKYINKWGGKIENINLGFFHEGTGKHGARELTSLQSQKGFYITPQMVSEVTALGQPMFGSRLAGGISKLSEERGMAGVEGKEPIPKDMPEKPMIFDELENGVPQFTGNDSSDAYGKSIQGNSEKIGQLEQRVLQMKEQNAKLMEEDAADTGINEAREIQMNDLTQQISLANDALRIAREQSSLREQKPMTRQERFDNIKNRIDEIKNKKLSFKTEMEILNDSLTYLKQERSVFKRAIRRYKDGYLDEEYNELPVYYRSKEGNTLDDLASEAGFDSDMAFRDYLIDINDQIKKLGIEKEALKEKIQTETNRKIVKSEIEYLTEKLSAFQQGKLEGRNELQAIKTHLGQIARKVLPTRVRWKALSLVQNVDEKNFAVAMNRIANIYKDYESAMIRGAAVKRILKTYKHPENVLDVKYQELIDKMRDRLGEKKADRKKTLRYMTTEDLVNLARKVAFLEEKGKLSFKSRQDNRAMAREIMRASLIRAAGGEVDAGVIGSYEERKRKGEGFTAFRRANIRPIEMIDRIFGKHGKDLIYSSIDYSETVKTAGIFNRTTAIKKVFRQFIATKDNKLGDAIGEHNLGQSVTIDGVTFQMNDIMAMYAQRNNEHARKAIVFGNKMPEDLYNKFTTYLEKEHPNYVKFVDKVKEIVGERYEEARQVMADSFNVVMPKESDYFPMFRVRFDAVADPEAKFAMDLIADADLKTMGGVDYTGAAKGFTFSRQEIADRNQQPISLDFMGDALRAIETQEHFINFAKIQKMINGIKGDEALRNAVTYNHGAEAWAALDDYFNIAINPRINKVSLDFVSKRVRVMRKAVGTAYLGFNVVSALKQLPSAHLALPWTNLVQLHKSIINVVWSAVNGGELINKIYELDPSIKNRVMDRDLNEFRSNYPRLAKNDIFRGLQIAHDQLGKSAFDLILLMDKWTVLASYDAVYESQRRIVGDEEARKIAHEVYIKTQNQGRMIDLPELYRTNNEFLRMVLMFTNQLNSIYNMLREGVPNNITNKEYGKAIAQVSSIVVSSFLIYLASTGGTLPDPDDEDAFLQWFDALAGSAVSALPIVGNLVLSGARGYSPSISPADSVIQGLKRSLWRFKNEEYGRGAAEVLLNAGIVAGVGLPMTQPLRTINGAIDYIDSNTDDWRRLIWSRSALNEK